MFVLFWGGSVVVCMYAFNLLGQEKRRLREYALSVEMAIVPELHLLCCRTTSLDRQKQVYDRSRMQLTFIHSTTQILLDVTSTQSGYQAALPGIGVRWSRRQGQSPVAIQPRVPCDHNIARSHCQ